MHRVQNGWKNWTIMCVVLGDRGHEREDPIGEDLQDSGKSSTRARGRDIEKGTGKCAELQNSTR